MVRQRKQNSSYVEEEDVDEEETPKKKPKKSKKVEEDVEDEFDFDEPPRSQKKGRKPMSTQGQDDDDEDEKPQKKGRRKKQVDSDFDSDDEEGGKTLVSNEELQIMVTNFVRLALAMDSKKLPIQRKDIQTHITGQHKKRGLLEQVVEQGKIKLEEIFGLELLKIEKSEQTELEKSKTKKAKPVTQCWILRLLNPQQSKEKNVSLFQEESFAPHGFLMMILGLIISQISKSISEYDLWNHLEKMGFQKKKFIQQVGYPEERIDDFVRQGYITRKNVESTNEEKKMMHMYLVGPRTKAESMDEMILIKLYENVTGTKTDRAILREMGISDSTQTATQKTQ